MRYVLAVDVPNDVERGDVHELAAEVQEALDRSQSWYGAKVTGQEVKVPDSTVMEYIQEQRKWHPNEY
jgi:hypothetical protein